MVEKEKFVVKNGFFHNAFKIGSYDLKKIDEHFITTTIVEQRKLGQSYGCRLEFRIYEDILFYLHRILLQSITSWTRCGGIVALSQSEIVNYRLAKAKS
jgi:hypothetical protein